MAWVLKKRKTSPTSSASLWTRTTHTTRSSPSRRRKCDTDPTALWMTNTNSSQRCGIRLMVDGCVNRSTGHVITWSTWSVYGCVIVVLHTWVWSGDVVLMLNLQWVKPQIGGKDRRTCGEDRILCTVHLDWLCLQYRTVQLDTPSTDHSWHQETSWFYFSFPTWWKNPENFCSSSLMSH